MVRIALVEGLKNAMRRGETLEQAKQSFISAGYNSQEVEEASKYVKALSYKIQSAQRAAPTIQPKPVPRQAQPALQPVQPMQKPAQPVQRVQPAPIQPRSLPTRQVYPSMPRISPSTFQPRQFKPAKTPQKESDKGTLMLIIILGLVLLVLVILLLLMT